MATYIQGLTDYIPQAQPFTPDYNFLGNVLQTRQSRYDTAHKQLNKMYGTLLYSPMLRDENIQARDQFFKNIDQDIKKMSGLDLSLQQNVDAASNVFKSIYDNKGIIKDMTFTKQYQNELERAENFKNCTDQEKCGGGYWDVGVNALKYRADEFKNASADEAMNMSAPEYTPFINVMEKSMNYFKDLKSKGFGVTTVDKSPDGRYIVTQKDGQNLTMPLYQLMQSQYAQDYKIQNMYKTMAYVQRKNYIELNADKYGGDKGAAEDAYIQSVQDALTQIREKAADVKLKSLGAQAKKEALAEKIRKDGTTGNDALANAYHLASHDYDQHVQVEKYYDGVANATTGVTNSGDNRKMKAANVDAIVASGLMENDFKEAAINISNLTGETKIEADPYAKSYYDFSLSMQRLAKEHEYAKDLELFKAKVDIAKKQAEGEATARGPAGSTLNTPKRVDALGTAASDEKTNEALESAQYYADQTTATEKLANEYVTQYVTHLMNVVTDPHFTANQKQAVKAELKNIFPQYNPATNQFIDDSGKSIDYQSIFDSSPFGTYNKVLTSRKNATMVGLDGDWLSQNLDPIENQYSTYRKLLDVASKVYKENNLNVLSIATSSDQYLKNDSAKTFFKSLFQSDGTLLGKNDWTQMMLKNTNGLSANDLETMYDNQLSTYNLIYNSGTTVADPKDPTKKIALIKPLHDGNSQLGMLAEGKGTGGALQWSFDASAPAAQGTAGLITFGQDALNSANTLYTSGIVAEQKNTAKAENALPAQRALQSVINDINTRAYDINDKNRPFGKVTYLDLALSDPKYRAIHIDFAPSYMQQYKGTDESPDWGSNANIMQNGITVYVPKEDTLENSFTKAVEAKPYDILLNYTDATITTDKGGSVNIKRDPKTGRFVTSGYINSYDFDANGNPVKIPVNVSKTYSADLSGQTVYDGISAYLNEMDQANKDFERYIPVDKYYDPSSLPDISASSGNMDALQQFNQLIGQ